MAHLMRWPDLPLRTKGLIVVAFPAAATVIIACASYLLGARAAEGEESALHGARVTEEILRIVARENELGGHAGAYFITAGEASAIKMRDTIAAFDAARQRLAGLVAEDDAQTRRLIQVAALERSLVERIFVAMARFQSGALPRAELRVALGAAETDRLRMENILATMQEEEQRLLDRRLRNVAELRAELRATSGICVIFGVAGGVVISVLFASGITNRIRKLRENMVQFASGAVPAPLPGGRDEIGALSEGMSVTAGILRQRTEALENALHGIAEADAAGLYVSCNKAYAALAGLDEGNLPATVAATVHAEDRANVEAAIASMRVNGRSEIEARLADPRGRVAVVGMTFLPASKHDGGYYVFLCDISLRKETEAALVRAKDAAVASNLARTGFLAKISHDIRTPLNAILGAADLLSQTSLDFNQSQYVGMFQRNCRRLVALINDFLDLSRIEAGAVHMENVTFRIRETVGDAVNTFRESSSRKGIRLATDIDSGVPEWVLGDALRVQQVLVNLLSNAIKFTAEGSVSVTVRKERRSNGEALVYEVTDTGPGIESADQTRIFAAFTQLPDQAAGSSGSGLGLTICRELVERMRGEMGLRSRKGCGSTFYFGLPLVAGQPAETCPDGDAGAPPDPALSRWTSGETARILVAEDTEDNRFLLEHYLREEPVEIVFATTGYEAIEAMRQKREFDLVLMDIDLPGIDGYAATRQILEWQAARGMAPTPIVALSAHAMREAVRQSLDAGCLAHIAKPIDRAMLIKTIRHYIRPRSVQASTPAEAAPLAEGVAALVPKFLASKPQQIEEARLCLAAKDFEPIRRFGHNLRGTGPGYGFPRIEQLGRDIEKAAVEGDESRIAQQLEALHGFIISQSPIKADSADVPKTASLTAAAL